VKLPSIRPLRGGRHDAPVVINHSNLSLYYKAWEEAVKIALIFIIDRMNSRNPTTRDFHLRMSFAVFRLITV